MNICESCGYFVPHTIFVEIVQLFVIKWYNTDCKTNVTDWRANSTMTKIAEWIARVIWNVPWITVLYWFRVLCFVLGFQKDAFFLKDRLVKQCFAFVCENKTYIIHLCFEIEQKLVVRNLFFLVGSAPKLHRILL